MPTGVYKRKSNYITCEICGCLKQKSPAKKSRFCSNECKFTWRSKHNKEKGVKPPSRKGTIPWNKDKIADGTNGLKRGQGVSNWKGDNVGYDALHDWVKRWKGAPSICENCGITKGRTFDWANIDHKYRRVLEDYIRMCRPCHRKYDYKNNKK